MYRPRVVFLIPFAWLAILGDCSSSGGGPNTKIGGPCAKGNACADDQVCDLTDPSGKPVCIDANGDLDGDGIPNDKDFCEHKMGGAFDEDGDGIGDDCDACPISKPVSPPDTDGDGVDSPCDPAPDVPGDKIVLFNGFNADLPTGAVMKSGNWQVSGGELIATSGTNGTAELVIPFPGLTTTPHTEIFTAYRIDKLDGDNNQIKVEGVANLQMGVFAVSCGTDRSTDGDELLATSDSGGTGVQPFNNLFDTKSLYRVTEQLEGVAGNCAIIADNENGATQTQGNGEPITEVHLVVSSATARFQYILIVQR